MATFCEVAVSSTFEHAARDQGNAQRLKIAVAHPGQLDIEIFVRWRLVSGHVDVAGNVVIDEVGIVGGADAANAGHSGKGIEHILFQACDG